jgi:FimV-like protein
MKRKFTPYILPLLFLCAVGFVVLRYYQGERSEYVAFYPLQERKGATALAPEWVSTKGRAESLIRVVRDNPKDIKSTIALATLYIQEARVTGNSTYYNIAALRYLDAVLEQDAQNIEALSLKALVNLSQHHFSEALVLAEQAQKAAPYNAFVYGLLIDGNVEMGNYEAAVAAAEKMIELRPDIRSYSRIGYLREIHGDLPGAIEAMERAVKAGGVGDEPTSWVRVQLGRLYEQAGDLPRAEMHYNIALDQRPGYAYALAGMGRIHRAKKEWAKAIAFYQQADTIVADPLFKEELAQLYFDMGNKEQARKLLHSVIEEVSDAVKQGEDDASAAHHAGDQLAFGHMLLGDYDAALPHALDEYNRRPKNIEMAELVAWIYHLNGNSEKAMTHAATALSTGCANPRLLARMGLIYAQAGANEKAKSMLQAAIKNQPFLPGQLQQQVSSALQNL